MKFKNKNNVVDVNGIWPTGKKRLFHVFGPNHTAVGQTDDCPFDFNRLDIKGDWVRVTLKKGWLRVE